MAAGTASVAPNTPADEDTLCELRKVNANVQTKKHAAKTAVVRDKKLAEPDAPNKLPEEPLPKAAPISAPLPCCISTNPITPNADKICPAMINVFNSISDLPNFDY